LDERLAGPAELEARTEQSPRGRQLFTEAGVPCLLLASGRVACWGIDGWVKPEWPNAAIMPNLSDVVDLQGVGNHLCALNGAGAVNCAQLRMGPNHPASRVAFDGLRGIVELEGRCVRRASGEVECLNGDELVRVTPLTGASELHPFLEGGCGLVGTKALCASSGAQGKVARLENAIEMGSGHGFFCARSADKRVFCRDPWGYEPPFELPGLAGTSKLELSAAVACGLSERRGVVCSAVSSSGDRGTKGAKAGFEIPGLNGVRQLTLGHAKGCAVLEGGRVACFHLLPEPSQREPPCLMPVSEAVEATLDSSDKLLCVRRQSGAVRCWNDDGTDGREVLGLP
jgi:hypothetical protein